jgi:AcrR family transcriptional regulator
MGEPREPYHHGDLRNALVASAVRLIEAEGPGAFSLREAAREVGVSANAAYRHFDDKSALMTAAAAEGFAKLAKRMRRAMDRAESNATEEAPALARFKAVGRAYVEFACDHPELFRLMFGARGVECFHGAAEPPPAETPWTLLAGALDALVSEGILPAARRPGAELAAWSVVHGFASLALEGLAAPRAGRERAAALEAVLSFAVVGICGEVSASRRRPRSAR